MILSRFQALILVFGIIFCGSVFSRATESISVSSNGLVLSEAEAVNLALRRNLELAALELTVREQEKRAGAGPGLTNPELRIQDISSKYAYSDENRELQVGLRWRPPKIGEYGVLAQREHILLLQERIKARLFRLELVGLVRETWTELALRQDLVRFADREVALAERGLATWEALAGLNQQNLLDLIKSRRRLLKARSDARQARARAANARAKLSTLTGETRDFSLSPAGLPVPAPDLERLRGLARENRPEFAFLDQGKKLAAAWHQAKRCRWLPWFSFFELSYHFEGKNRDWGELSLGLELPLFHRIQGDLKTAVVLAEAGVNTPAATEESLDREILSSLSRYRQAFAEWRSLAAEAEALTAEPGSGRGRNAPPALSAEAALELELVDLEIRQMVREARFELDQASIKLSQAAGVERWEDLLTPSGEPHGR